MANFIGVPQGCEATAIILDNCSRQLRVLAQAYGRNDLQDEIPSLTNTARNSAKLAGDMLDGLIEQLGAEPPKGKRQRRTKP